MEIGGSQGDRRETKVRVGAQGNRRGQEHRRRSTPPGDKR